MLASRFIVLACARTRGRSPRSFVRANSTRTQDDKALHFSSAHSRQSPCPRPRPVSDEFRDAAAFEQVRTESWRLRADGCFSAPSKFYGQAERAISTGKLHALLRFNFPPINQVVFLGPSYPFWVGRSHLRACFPLICIQRLSQPNFATQPCPWQDNWNTRGSSIPVLSY